MQLHEIKTKPRKSKQRVGRGIGSGVGKTAGRGTKGQNSRSGGGVRPGFEGGQNPLAKRIPKKRGFRAFGRVEYAVINLTKLADLKATTVTNQTLVDARLIRDMFTPVKVLGDGKLDKKLAVHLQAATKSATEAITKAGGSFEAVPAAKAPKRPSKRNRKS